MPESIGHFHCAYRMQLPVAEDGEAVFGNPLIVDLEVMEQESEWAFILHDEELRDVEQDKQKDPSEVVEDYDDEDMFPSISLYKSLFDNAVEVGGCELDVSSIQSSGAATLQEIATLSRGGAHVSTLNERDEVVVALPKYAADLAKSESSMENMLSFSEEVHRSDSRKVEEVVAKMSELLPEVQNDVEAADSSDRKVEFNRSMARSKEMDLLRSMGFNDIQVLIPLLAQHVRKDMEEVDMEAMQRIIGTLLN